MQTENNAFRVVIFSDQELWVAQCLEVDVCVTARRRDDLPKKIVRQLRGQAILDASHGKRPFESFPRAPERFWQMYSEAQQLGVAELRESWFFRILNALRGVPGLRAQLTLATV
jgi:hypothetical protein